MPLPELRVIDASRFPIVTIDGPNLMPGNGPYIIDDLETLIEHGKPFVLIIVNGGAAQDRQHDEDKERMLWLKQNRERLGAVCKGIVSVVLDGDRLALIEKQAAGLGAALGIRFAAVSSHSAAEAFAHERIRENP
ncbi:hypothetical protein [Achromobacter aloeverae]